jgi:hypothetical protein
MGGSRAGLKIPLSPFFTLFTSFPCASAMIQADIIQFKVDSEKALTPRELKHGSMAFKLNALQFYVISDMNDEYCSVVVL